MTAIAKNPIDQKRKRRSIRLQGYDYSQAGAYYITMCTRNRECLFGNVIDGQIQLNEVGRIVQTVWNGLPQFYEGVELDAFVVMPNHVHGVIVIHAGVGAIHESPLPFGCTCRRILPIKFPLRWVVCDVLSNTVEGYLVTDDVFVIIALPDRQARCFAKSIDLFGRNHFKPPNDL